MLDKLDAEFAFGREALDVRAYRQELLSSNIANADTPGYKARDVDFARSLAGALKKAGGCGHGRRGARTPRRLPMAQPAGVSERHVDGVDGARPHVRQRDADADRRLGRRLRQSAVPHSDAARA